jgi:drug/metabolite transporter (DMT)-like permease
LTPHPLRQALPLFLLAGVCFSTLDATAKYLVRDHTLFVVVWARYVGQMLITTPLALHQLGPGFWRTRRPVIQLLRSLCLVTATMCFFGSLRYLPLAEASAITFLAPMIAIVLAMPVLGERPTRARWMSAIGGFRRHPHPHPSRIGRVPSGHGAPDRRRLRQRALPAPHAQAPR